MTLRQRSLAGDADRRGMAALVEAYPALNFHVVDLPYRLCSWGLDESGNSGLWFSAEGELRAWVVMQSPFWCIDIVLHPEEQALYPQLLAWAEQRAAELLGGPYGRPAWFVHVAARHSARQSALEAAGFAPQGEASQHPWSMVMMQRSGQPLAECDPPAGLTIRPLAGLAEVDAYVACHQAAFQSDSMRAKWRAHWRILRINQTWTWWPLTRTAEWPGFASAGSTSTAARSSRWAYTRNFAAGAWGGRY
jgi:hypothetical protein